MREQTKTTFSIYDQRPGKVTEKREPLGITIETEIEHAIEILEKYLEKYYGDTLVLIKTPEKQALLPKIDLTGYFKKGGHIRIQFTPGTHLADSQVDKILE